MKMNRTLVILISLMLALPMMGQPHRRGDEKSFKAKLEATKVAYFTEKLNLTPEEAQVFWPVYNKWWGERQEANKKVRESMVAIEKLEEKGGYTDPQMKKLIKEYSKNLALESEIFDMYIEEFYKVLPTGKVAKIFVAEKGFRDMLTKMWREKKHPRPEMPPHSGRPDPSKKPE